MSDINMDWQVEDYTVYALNDEGVNDFSFFVRANGRWGHDPKTLLKVASMASAAPDMYEALEQAKCSMLDSGYSKDGLVILCIDEALKKARGEV